MKLVVLSGSRAPLLISFSTVSEAAMRSAEEIGAGGQPEASLHLKYAQDQLQTAQRLMDDGDEKRARRMLDRAHADAALALALARTERDRAAARAAWIEVDELRSETASETTEPTPRVEPLEGMDKETDR